jgi:hypothetical protein
MQVLKMLLPCFRNSWKPPTIQEIWPSYRNSSNVFPYAFRPNLVIIGDTTVPNIELQLLGVLTWCMWNTNGDKGDQTKKKIGICKKKGGLLILPAIVGHLFLMLHHLSPVIAQPADFQAAAVSKPLWRRRASVDGSLPRKSLNTYTTRKSLLSKSSDSRGISLLLWTPQRCKMRKFNE